MTYRYLFRTLATVACAGGVYAAAACSETADAPPPGLSRNPNIGEDGEDAGSANINVPETGPIVDPDSGREVVCDDAGNCTCINIGMLGRLGTYGAVPGQDNTAALQQWLNTKSSALVDVHLTAVTLTREFLDQYDVLIIQALEDREGGPYWSHTADEIATLEAWVREGGGIIAMTGYGGQSAEVNPTNQLLAFTGMSYNTDDVLYTCPDSCCYCVGNSVPLGGWNAEHPISAHITNVGVFHGRTINVPPEAQIVVGNGSTVYGATVTLDSGRVFMFTDEWVTYTSQWTGEGVGEDCTTYDVNHTCYNVSAETSYQVPQFWYNAILWASGDPTCFTIDEPSIVY